MDHQWKSIVVNVPADLSPREVMDHVHAQIRIAASKAGESVERIQIGVGGPASNGWRTWSATYLPGPIAQEPLVSA